MFKDYYIILDISEGSTLSEIKAAFKKQALLWHPDINKSESAQNKMQDINEAYLILKDIEARKHYDVEYQIFKKFRRQFTRTSNKGLSAPVNIGQDFDYKIKDELLNRWIINANQQSRDLVKISIEELFGMTSAGLRAATTTLRQGFSFQLGCVIVVAIILIFLALLQVV